VPPLQSPAERLQTFRAEHPARYLEAGGVRWEYLVGGSGPQTLLLLNGSLRVAESAFAYAGLFEDAYRVVVATYPAVWTIDEITDGMAAILDAEGAGRVLTLGQSYGALVAHAFACRHPARVEKIVFSSPSVIAATGPQQKLLGIIDTVFTRIPERLLMRLWLRTLQRVIVVPGSEFAFWQSYLKDLFERRLTKADVLSHFRTAADSFKTYGYTLPAQARWPGPVLIVGGARDPVSTDAHRQQLRQFYPQARVHVIPDAGHTLGLDRPEQYAAAVLEFFKPEG
jgi:pimeloyl-ACP methyl ester carboxylesterase